MVGTGAAEGVDAVTFATPRYRWPARDWPREPPPEGVDAGETPLVADKKIRTLNSSALRRLIAALDPCLKFFSLSGIGFV